MAWRRIKLIATEAPDLKAVMLDIIREEHGLAVDRGGMHVSDLIYCLTKAYWAKTDPEPLTEAEIGLFSIGWGLERVMIPRLHVKPLVVDGITGTIDFMLEDVPADLKSTRLAPDGRKGEGGFKMPEGWMHQFQAYRYMVNQAAPSMYRPNQFIVAVLHLIQPVLKVWRLHFSHQELEENWQWLVDRSNILESMLAARNPMPYQHRLGEWECQGCTYSLKCGLVASLEKRTTNG